MTLKQLAAEDLTTNKINISFRIDMRPLNLKTFSFHTFSVYLLFNGLKCYNFVKINGKIVFLALKKNVCKLNFAAFGK